jgi:hypothetical protein
LGVGVAGDVADGGSVGESLDEDEVRALVDVQAGAVDHCLVRPHVVATVDHIDLRLLYGQLHVEQHQAGVGLRIGLHIEVAATVLELLRILILSGDVQPFLQNLLKHFDDLGISDGLGVGLGLLISVGQSMEDIVYKLGVVVYEEFVDAGFDGEFTFVLWVCFLFAFDEDGDVVGGCAFL